MKRKQILPDLTLKESSFAQLKSKNMKTQFMGKYIYVKVHGKLEKFLTLKGIFFAQLMLRENIQIYWNTFKFQIKAPIFVNLLHWFHVILV